MSLTSWQNILWSGAPPFFDPRGNFCSRVVWEVSLTSTIKKYVVSISFIWAWLSFSLLLPLSLFWSIWPQGEGSSPGLIYLLPHKFVERGKGMRKWESKRGREKERKKEVTKSVFFWMPKSIQPCVAQGPSIRYRLGYLFTELLFLRYSWSLSKKKKIIP